MPIKVVKREFLDFFVDCRAQNLKLLKKNKQNF